MKKIGVKVRSFIIFVKIMLMRSSTYIALVNLGMIFFLTLSKMKEIGMIKVNLDVVVLPLYIGTFIILFILGWIDFYLLKGYQDEVNKLNVLTPLHPLLAEMKQKVDWMYEKQNTNDKQNAANDINQDLIDSYNGDGIETEENKE